MLILLLMLIQPLIKNDMLKTKSIYLYECSFTSLKSTSIRHVLVCADSFGRASALANSVASRWEDSDAYELYCIQLKDVVITNA